MKANYLLFCENLLRDESNKVTLVNIFDIVGSQKAPAVPPKFVIAFSFYLSDEDLKSKNTVNFCVIVKDKKGKEVIKISGSARCPKEPGNVLGSADLSGKLAFKAFGKYTAKLIVDDLEIFESVLRVVQGTQKDYQK